jgi:NAD(P)-dependent dehydrogenase (short-subunit alcohol dehydrogenase family)
VKQLSDKGDLFLTTVNFFIQDTSLTGRHTMRLENKIAVVTGGGMGIGRSGALAFAAEGAAVAVADVNIQAANEVVEEIRSGGGQAVAVLADVSKSADAERIAQETVQAFGGIDFLLNNAGIQTYGTVTETDEETWDRTLNINLKGMYLVAKYCIPEMLKRGGGAIVNIASIQGIANAKRVAAYAAAKGGVIALTRTIGVDYARENIRCNCICPGGVITPMMYESMAMNYQPEQYAEEIRKSGQNYPVGRLGEADEIAKVAVFLCTSDSSFMTGSTVVVDGGYMAAL